MRSHFLDRRAPLAGPLFVALLVIGGPVLSGSTPEADATPSRVIAFYTAHRTSERAAAIVLALAFLSFLLLAGSLRARWHRHEPLATGMLATAVLATVGQTVNAGILYTLAEAPQRLAPASAQTLNLLQNDLVLTSAVGLFAFGVVAGVAILRGVGLPAWLGWLAIASGVLFVAPAAELGGLLLLVIWAIAVGVLSMGRDPLSASAGEPQPEAA